MTREELLQAVKEAVQAAAPDASVILFGSRARGDAQPDSDWDFLVLTDEPLSEASQESVNRRIWELGWDEGLTLSTLFYTRSQWQEPRRRAAGFHRAVEREGILL